MKLGRAVFHGFVLSVITLGAVAVGFVFYRTFVLHEQIAVQVLVAGLVCVAAFAAWSYGAHRLTAGELSLGDLKELGIAYAAAFLWTPVLFIPLHVMVQGNMSSVGNVLSVWLFQLPFNLLALMVANGRLLQDAVGDSENRSG